MSYARATALGPVVAALGEPGTAVIAGGTELLNWMRLGIAAPSRLVDLQDVRGDGDGDDPAAGIRVEGGRLRIGALSTLGQVGADPLVAEHATALAEACLAAASAQVRNRATLGGNLLQKTRCPYFRAEEPMPWGCNKRHPGTGCAARHGLNDQHALFGWTDDCVATQPSDPVVALAALDAELVLAGPAGTRTVPAAGFCTTQQEATDRGTGAATGENVLTPAEVVVAVRVPVVPGRRSSYVKVRERESYAYALASAAASVVMDGERVASLALAVGSVAQRPWRLPAAEAALRGVRLTEAAAVEAVRAATADARPLEHNAYKLTIARGAAVRALLTAAGAA